MKTSISASSLPASEIRKKKCENTWKPGRVMSVASEKSAQAGKIDWIPGVCTAAG